MMMIHTTSRLVLRRSLSCFALSASIITSAAAFRDVAAPNAGVAPSIQAAASTQPAAAGATLDEAKLKPRTAPVHCAGVESVQLDGVLLKVDRVAIQALAECKVHITNSHIVGRVAVMAAGKAAITFENCLIEGTLQLAGDSVTSIKSSTVRGRVRKLQTAEMKDLGKNLWR
jgi:hypothetical protein